MKTITSIGLSALLLSMAFAGNAQNVWTGTSIPTTTTTGKVGVGVATPAAQLDISTGSPYPVGLKVKRTGLQSGVNNIVEVWNYDTELDFWIDGGGFVGIKRLATSGANKMVTVGSSGILETQDIPAADNLGNHIATKDLQMNSWGINNCGKIWLGSSTATSATISSVSLADLTIRSGNTGLGKFASTGYKLDVDGNVRCVTLYQTSDGRLKTQIKPITNTSGLMEIKPYTYQFKKESTAIGNPDNKLHYGFIAQEIEPYFPELVSKDDNGYYAVNYVEFIPILLKELQDQNKKINTLEANVAEQDKRIAALEALIKTMPVSSDNGTMNHAIEALKGSTLYQNTPNPFNRETTIRYNITGQFDNAFIGIYDLNGKQVKRITVKETNGQIVVPANILSPGTYIYSLVVEGQLIDSKKMVVID